MSDLIINYSSFIGKEREDILEHILKFLIEREKKKIKRRPDLKIFIVKSYNFSPNQIKEYLKANYSKNKEILSFLENFVITVQNLKNKNFYLNIAEIISKKKFHIIIFDDIEYWTIISYTKSENIDRTIKKLIKLIPDIEIISLTSRHRENIMEKEELMNSMRGFISS